MKTMELNTLVRELEERQHHGVRRDLKNGIWRLTVWGSYKLKRAVDVVASGLGMALLSPLFVGIALAVRLTSPGPAFFSQVRVGRFGRHFKFYKFRSMYVDAEARKAALMAQNESKDGVIFKMKNDPRITPVGRFLRRTSLDELPQLFNVFIGDMSLVGPRPLPIRYLPRYTPEQARRHEVRPGVTGLAQVNGRNALDWDEKFRYDVAYVDSHSFAGDLKILAQTFLQCLRPRGISHPGEATMREFGEADR